MPARQYAVCFVCSGNICRSPMGDVILNAMLDERPELRPHVHVDSAGMGGWHVGEGADRRARQVLHAHGYDGSAHVVRQFDALWLAEKDLVLAADRGHVRQLSALVDRAGTRTPTPTARVELIRSFDPQAARAGTLEVDDPWYGDLADFERTFREVEAACRGIVEALPGLLEARDGTAPR